VHRLSTSFIFGYHGCDRAFGRKLLAGHADLQISENDYDWLGPGVYFWESNPQRALQFAREKKARGENIKEPFVVGAVLDLGNCLDLTTADSIDYLRLAHESLTETFRARGLKMPTNGPRPWERFLDCAVLRRLHEIVKDSSSVPIDTVRGVFQEGPEAYPGSAFLEKTHIQIAVMNPDCIKAVFRVPKDK
jgi:hypothetical protein